MEIKRTERGWAGHFCAASYCSFRRNTLLKLNEIKVVISTVGGYKPFNKVEEISCNRYYETMVFYTDENDLIYNDIDVSKEISFVSPWCINSLDNYPDNRANEMHENVVKEISEKMINKVI
jgi:hypothetical protein